MSRHSLTRGLLAVAMAAICGTAGASGLQVAPVGLEFPAASPAQGLWLTNTGSDALHAQVRVFHWTQADGRDMLTPTRELVASPPMLTLAPGARQLVRVIRLDTTHAGTSEDAYRLLVDELPQADGHQQAGVQYVLRYSLPVFVDPANLPEAGSVASSLHWSLVRENGEATLQVQNPGRMHAQVSDVSLLPPGGAPIEVTAGLLGYVLPGMTMRWPLKVSASRLPAGTTLKVEINGKPADQTLQIDGLPR
ncbi:MAG TPA: molecular chaperone [Rhodanobacteraceae bacterium]|nr:molecular chaperone [Rhodanobacteraceae bacterium]